MQILWNSKLRGRSWVQTLSQGLTQIFTRVLGTTVIAPVAPRRLMYSASLSTQPTYAASRSTAPPYLASES